MYRVDRKDRVRQLEEVPQSDVGAPLPVVFADEHTLVLAYHSAPKPTWEKVAEIDSPRVVDAESEGTIAIVSFAHAYASFFGPPNDEAFNGHPLASRGLHPYGAFEVERSSWLREAERRNRVHPNHRPQAFGGLRHFIFAFHDSTFEALAEAFEVRLMVGSITTAVREMTTRLVS